MFERIKKMTDKKLAVGIFLSGLGLTAAISGAVIGSSESASQGDQDAAIATTKETIGYGLAALGGMITIGGVYMAGNSRTAKRAVDKGIQREFEGIFHEAQLEQVDYQKGCALREDEQYRTHESGINTQTSNARYEIGGPIPDDTPENLR